MVEYVHDKDSLSRFSESPIMKKLYTGFMVDSTPIPVMDAGIEISVEALDSSESGRDESGVMHRIVIAEKTIVTIRYGTLTLKEYAYIMSLFRGKAQFWFTWEDDLGVCHRYLAYCSKLAATLYNRKLGIYKNMTLKIIEC